MAGSEVSLSYDVPVATDGSLRVDARLENGPAGGSAAIVPEPSTALLLAAGFVGLAMRRRERPRRDVCDSTREQHCIPYSRACNFR